MGVVTAIALFWSNRPNPATSAARLCFDPRHFEHVSATTPVVPALKNYYIFVMSRTPRQIKPTTFFAKNRHSPQSPKLAIIKNDL
jgi:hypothetical protein